MYEIPYKDFDYCNYGMPYRKRTRFQNNVCQRNPKQLCKKYCGNIIDNRHIAAAQRGPSKHTQNNRFKQDEFYVIPEPLIYEIFNSIPIISQLCEQHKTNQGCFYACGYAVMT